MQATHTLKYACLAVLFAIASSLSAQIFHYERFSAESGLGNAFISTIDQASSGYILVGTGEGIYQYNGTEFESVSNLKEVKEAVVSTSFEDRSGNIWYGTANGQLLLYNGQAFNVLPKSEALSAKIVQILQSAKGQIWAITQNQGIVKVSEDGNHTIVKEPVADYLLTGGVITQADQLLIGTDMGLMVIDKLDDFGDNSVPRFLDNITMSGISVIRPSKVKGLFYVAAEDEGIIRVKSENDGRFQFSISSDNDKLRKYQITDMDIDAEGNIWISTNRNSLLKYQMLPDGVNFRLIDYNHDNSLGCNSIKTCFSDPERNLWIGTYGQGLFKLDDRFFNVFSYAELDRENQNIGAVFEDGLDFYVGGVGSLLQLEKNPAEVKSFYGKENGLPDSQITGIVKVNENELWVSTDGEGLFSLDIADSTFTQVDFSVDELSNTVLSMASNKEEVVIGTMGGFFRFEIASRKWESFTTTEGIPHNFITDVAYLKDAFYIGLKGGQLIKLIGSEWQLVTLKTDQALSDIQSMAMSDNGEIWLATAGSGLLQLKSNECVVWKKQDGLMSNFCYSVALDDQNSVWTTHRGSLSKLNLSDFSVATYDRKDGLDMAFNPQAILRDAENRLWFGADKGLLAYDSDLDIENKVEPIVNFTSVEIGDEMVDFTQPINLDYGTYDVKFNFLGLSFRQPEGVEYRYTLDGYDVDWSERTKARRAIYNRLSSGDYRFHLKAYNADGVGGETIRTVELSIARPIWQKWWFFLLVTSVIFAVVRYFIIRRERFLKRNQDYLQKELDQRTAEVVTQKEMLEEKNKDITDSIEYAKNIQSAMLPSKSQMSNAFSDAFIFFKPRDIVSGDFYWVKEYEEVVVLVCADCTGHGVPGAFMSLISISILKEVSNSPDITSPAEALDKVQEVMLKTLNTGGDKVSDGMDVAIMEFNKTTNVLRMASARRPVVINKGDEQILLQGDRVSIGDRRPGHQFAQQEIQLEQGDSFYAFSDGYADQFGGKKGKKLKSKALYELLFKIRDFEMEEQGAMVEDYFEQWLGSYTQIDDVIVLGVKV